MSITIQIFGTRKSKTTKKAERFFKERRFKPHMVDVDVRPMSLGELGHFVRQHGLESLINTSSKAYKDQGLAYMRLSDEQWCERLCATPELMVQPLVRVDKTVTVGWDEAFWKAWYNGYKAA